MKVNVDFYSDKPRLRAGFIWTTDTVPSIGDIITVPNRYISEWDRKYFKEWERDCQRSFKVKERVFIIDPNVFYHRCNVSIQLEWIDDEKNNIKKYLNKIKR